LHNRGLLQEKDPENLKKMS